MAIKRKIKRSTDPCHFDVTGTEPDYKDIETLNRYLSGKARILPRYQTGICQKHQRRLATAIKRARHLGMLPFTPRV
jgi:small subunit ribosomal protein S18